MPPFSAAVEFSSRRQNLWLPDRLSIQTQRRTVWSRFNTANREKEEEVEEEVQISGWTGWEKRKKKKKRKTQAKSEFIRIVAADL